MAAIPEAPTLFLRKATGLVKGWSKFDAFLYSFMSVNFVTLGLFFSLSVLGFVPDGQVLPALLLSGVFMSFLVVTYAGLISVMPRAGGDYVWQSRLLGGGIGFVLAGTGGAPLPLWPSPPLLASFYFHSPILSTIIVLAFGAWFLGWAGTLFLSSTRVIFAAAFDRILPERMADVSEHRHVPVWALILMLVPSLVVGALYAYTDNFATYILDAVLVITVTFFGTAIAAMILPWRKRHLYQNSPIARYRLAGVPVISIAGFVTAVFLGFNLWKWFQDDLYAVNNRDSLIFLGLMYVLVQRVPRGVVAVISPWNWPYTMPGELLAPALAYGNTVVWAAAPTTSVCAVRLAECLEAADLPPGVVNLVTGPGPVVGDELAASPGTQAVGFIGSVATGYQVARRAAGKELLLEMGGNGPLVVMDDADLDKAVDATLEACFLNAGQSCTAGERVLVHADARDDYLARLRSAVGERVRLGDPFDDATTMGPLNNEPTAAKTERHVTDALGRGATLVMGGNRAPEHG